MVNPNIKPGMIPAAKSPPIDKPVVTPMMTMKMEGGIMGPTVEEAAVTAALKPGS